MTCRWPVVRLGDYCLKIGSGATPRGGRETYLDAGPVAFIRSQNVHNDGFRKEGLAYITEEQAKKLDNVSVGADDVLINITGDSVARVCLAPADVLPARVNQHVAIIRPKSQEIDPRYLRFFLVAPRQQELLLSLASGGGTRKALTKTMLENLRIPKPPLDVQRRMVEPLDLIEQCIRWRCRTNDTLESLARAIFKSWFIDFDPVCAKATGQQPGRMDADTAALFPSEFEDSELGLIPKGWRVEPIGNVIDTVSGSTPSTRNPEYWEPAEYWWATPKDLSRLSSPVLWKTERRISEAGLQRIGSGLLPKGSLLLSSRAPIGYLALSQVPTAINQGFIGMLPAGHVTPSYMLFWCRFNMDTILQHANGSTFLEISRSSFRLIRMLVPPEPVVLRFHEVVDPLLERIAHNERLRGVLTELRDTLLPRLITGKLRIPEADELVQEAAS